MKYRGRMVLLCMSFLTTFIFWTYEDDLNPLFIIFALSHALISWVFGSWYDKSKFLSYHDALTGVFNRHYANVVFKKQLRRAVKHRQPIGFITIDIDQSKTINDSYGHDYGDFILKELTRLVKKSIRKRDILIRWGGDEFLLLLVNSNKADTEKFIKELNETVRTSCSLHPEGKKVSISLSIGFSMFPEDAKDANRLISLADERMYKMKNEIKSS